MFPEVPLPGAVPSYPWFPNCSNHVPKQQCSLPNMCIFTQSLCTCAHMKIMCTRYDTNENAHQVKMSTNENAH